MGNKFYTPDGFNDQFPGICGVKRELESKLRNLFLLNGYEEIETPGVEYFDVYKEFVDEEELYKFTDSKGSLLCNRYDGTIPTVRFCAGRNYTLPVRFSYIENMYRSGKAGGGKLCGFTQGGIELLGASGAKSDQAALNPMPKFLPLPSSQHLRLASRIFRFPSDRSSFSRGS